MAFIAAAERPPIQAPAGLVEPAGIALGAAREGPVKRVAAVPAATRTRWLEEMRGQGRASR